MRKVEVSLQLFGPSIDEQLKGVVSIEPHDLEVVSVNARSITALRINGFLPEGEATKAMGRLMKYLARVTKEELEYVVI